MHSFYLVPTFSGAGLASVCLGLTHALDQLGIRVAHYKPVSQWPQEFTTANPQSEAIDLTTAQHWMAQGQFEQLLEHILDDLQTLQQTADVIVVEGLVPELDEEYIDAINGEIARILGGDVILVSAPLNYSQTELNHHISVTASQFGGFDNSKLLGCIFNKVGAPTHQWREHHSHRQFDSPSQLIIAELSVFHHSHFRCLGEIPWDEQHVAPRCSDVIEHIQAKVINLGQAQLRRIKQTVVVARTVSHSLEVFKAGTLIVTPGDRDDILLAAALAELNGIPLAGLVLSSALQPAPATLGFCTTAFSKGLPVVSVATDTLDTAQWIATMSTEIPADDIDRRHAVRQSFAQAIDAQWLAKQSQLPQEMRLSPTAFKHLILTRARQHQARIVLPEGDEPRTVEAAITCARKNLAQCVLLVKPAKLTELAQSLNLTIPPGIEAIDPDSIRSQYVQAMVALRAHKGLTEAMALAQMEDNVVLATMMLAEGHVDGLVSGAEHTTANTIRPAMQLIKTRADCRLVSSIFFMLLPEQALVYGDCAVNPNPSAEDLADIAIQADITARAFGIEPSIAMISYSTGSSGTGADVEKVKLATQLAREKNPHLLIDGPLQYDAAAIAAVAKSKAPNSQVAGHANVFIFPDLNTGNTTYKAVQRSAHVVSIGPVLMGLKKPVNDLSRGASVEDIVYTIAITAIQSMSKP